MDFILSENDYIEYLKLVAQKIAQEREYISKLDATTGDGDHWANLNKGFSIIAKKTESWSESSLSKILRDVGMILMSEVGGSSGILYGNAYIKSAKTITNNEVLNAQGILILLRTQLEAIMKQGKAKPGYKTMIDPLYQAIESFQKKLDENAPIVEAVEAMREGAKKGMNATKQMEAVKGRASYRSDKGVGHLDPGAVTMYYQLDILADICKKNITNS